MHVVGSMELVGSRTAGRAVDLENHMSCDPEAEGTGMDMGIGLRMVGIVLPEEAEGLMWVLVLAVGVIG